MNNDEKLNEDIMKMLKKTVNMNIEDILTCLSEDEIESKEIVEKLDAYNRKLIQNVEEVEKEFKLDQEKLKLYILKNLQNGCLNSKNSIQMGAIEFLRDSLKLSNKAIYYINHKNGEIEEFGINIPKKNRNKTGYEEFLNDILLTDIELFICEDAILASYIKSSIIQKTEKRPNFKREMQELTIGEKTPYFPEVLRQVINFIHRMDYNKLLLISAYRKFEILNNYTIYTGIELEQEKVKKEKKDLIQICKMLKGKNASISGEGDIRGYQGTTQIDYSVSMLEKDLERFVDDKYYTIEEINQMKRSLLNEDIDFNSIENIQVFKLLELSETQLLDLIKASEQNFKWYINNRKPVESKIINIFKVYENPTLDLVEFFIAKVSKAALPKLYNDGTIKGEALSALKEENKINIEKLFDINSLLINAQSAETVFKLVNDNLLSKDRAKEYVTDDILKREVENENIDFVIKLHNLDIVSLEKIKEHINDDTMINEFEQGKKDTNKLLKLYSEGIITDEAVNLLIDEYNLDKEITNKFIEEDIMKYEDLQKLEFDVNLKDIEDIIKEEELYNEIRNEEEPKKEPKLHKAKLVIAYMINNEKLSDEEIDEIYKEGIIKEEDLFEFAKKGYFSQDIISKLYANSLMSKEKLEELVRLGILCEEQKNETIKQLTTEKTIENVQIALGIMIPDFKKGNYTNTFGNSIYGEPIKNKKSEIVIDPVARNLLIESYGAHIADREQRDKGDEYSPFDNYEFYIIADSEEDITLDSIIIAERYYIDRLSDENRIATGNATYMFRLETLARIGKKSKAEINDIMINGTDESVLKTNHVIKTSEKQPRGWARNLTEKVKKWKKGKSYKNENKKMTETMIKNIDGTVDQRTGKWTRGFDIYSDTGESVEYNGEDR